jgi:lysophospholipid acyltransferase (LPLAT)-like uncharacterized protein
MREHIKQLMKSLARVMFRSPASRAAISAIVAGYIRFVQWTSRIEYQVHPDVLPYFKGEKVAIFTFWHGRILLMPLFNPAQRRMHAMISIHRDGEWLAGLMARFGFGLVRGSSSRGGSAALRDAMQVLQAGENLSITPDGPRGPAEVAQQGAAALSSLTGVPIVPVSVSASNRRHIRSWDRFMIALPFSRIVLVVDHPPVFVAANADAQTVDAASAELTQVLRRLGQQADSAAAACPLPSRT